MLAPLRGRLVDRHGEKGLLLLAGGYTVGLLVLSLGAGWRWPAGVLVCAATVAGASAPPLIAVARALWPRVAGPDLIRAGHALNALLGDLGAVLGPGVALAAIGVGPLAGCAIVASLGVPRHRELPPAGSGGALRASEGLRTLVGAEPSLGWSSAHWRLPLLRSPPTL